MVASGRGQEEAPGWPWGDGRRSITDVELVVRTLRGSEEAFRCLVERYERPVFSLVVRMVKDRELAEDLAQESFIKAFRALSSYDHRRKFSSWLFKIAHNATIDHLRRSRLETQPLESSGAERTPLLDQLEDPTALSPEVTAESADLGRDLDRAIAGLRPEYREVIELRFRQGLSYQEIAEITDTAMGTVKTNIHRARKELAAALTALGWVPSGETPGRRGS